ncbi:DUF695 domain-containing protein [Roseivirga thermotolerans]|uniref:DUF695 domain-containing protein n=1 Tax=Roseivirga thermotolerans TaxID=1758176 RepID=A0ABQ3I890_9BACT|nr:DUF695 domain-containing protein [Roseivirga thermotolerans]GHE72840.1 hypothetical protein GCM10011340_31630 [Roseivirga thermotolerans]
MFSLFKKRRTQTSSSNLDDQKGIIGKFHESGKPVIVKFVNEIPNDETMKNLPWLTIISWKYDADINNGMPLKEVNKKMIKLEHALEVFYSIDDIRWIYNRTGNGLKEFNYQISDRDQFIKELNKALRGHERYPIEITFYEDSDWKGFIKLVKDFEQA